MIQWYPGHMAKAKKEIKEVLKLADIIYLVLDARAPRSSLNPDLVSLIGDKPILYIYNKGGLADLKRLNEIIVLDEIKNYTVVDALKRTNIQQITIKTDEMLKDYIQKQKERGYKNVMIRAVVMGVPNVGKSSLINTLAKRKAASVNKLPGHTKSLTWINISNLVYLLDSPGVLWPKFEDEITGYSLALTGAIKEEILPKEKLAIYCFDLLNKKYPNMLNSFYNIDNKNHIDFFTTLAKNRGFLNENNEANIPQAQTTFLNDVKNGNLGVICFD